MDFASIDEPGAVGAIRIARRDVIPRVCVDMKVRGLPTDLVDCGKDKPLFKIGLVFEGRRNWVAEQSADQAGLKQFESIHRWLPG